MNMEREHRDRGIAPYRLSSTSFRHPYWTIAQMVAQHSVGGCNLQPGDLIGTGTISGPTLDKTGAIVEVSLDGTRSIPLPASVKPAASWKTPRPSSCAAV